MRSTLRTMLRGPFFVVPGCHDLLSLRVAETAGAVAHYMSGYGVSLSLIGQPDAGLATYTEFVGRVAAMTELATRPLIADADTGFGGLLNVVRTVAGYERAGAAAIQIEDQEAPKKCGHVAGRRVVPMADMVRKLKVAVETRSDPDFLIVARTDARTEHGLDEALRRADAYAAAGADILFVESPENEDELARIAATLRGATVLANMVPGGSRTPIVAAETLAAMGFTFALYPSLSMMSASHGMRAALRHLITHQSMLGFDDLLTSDEAHALAGFPAVHAFDRRWAVARD